jgi:hypothetical protein
MSVFGPLRTALEQARDQITARLDAVEVAEAAFGRLVEVFACEASSVGEAGQECAGPGCPRRFTPNGRRIYCSGMKPGRRGYTAALMRRYMDVLAAELADPEAPAPAGNGAEPTPDTTPPVVARPAPARTAVAAVTKWARPSYVDEDWRRRPPRPASCGRRS